MAARDVRALCLSMLACGLIVAAAVYHAAGDSFGGITAGLGAGICAALGYRFTEDA